MDLTSQWFYYLGLALLIFPPILCYEFFKRKKILPAVICLLIFVANLVVLFTNVAKRDSMTLLEDVIEMKAVNGDENKRAPAKVMFFSVEHPNVEHTISLNPTYGNRLDKMNFDEEHKADYKLKIVSPAGTPTETTIKYLEWCARRKVASKDMKVESTEFGFTPTEAGRHELQITETGYPFADLHILVLDKAKKDGKRMEGY